MRKFDPYCLGTDDSINRVVIARLPLDADEKGEIEGRQAYAMLSSEALAARIRDGAARLGVEGRARSMGDGELLRGLNVWLESEEKEVRAEAEEIAGWFGRRLGYFLVTLNRGDRENREARPNWDESRWAHWGKIRKVMFGGGIMSGEFGRRAVRHAREVLKLGGVWDMELGISEWPSVLPMLGMARGAGEGEGSVPLVDFGGTFAKRGYAVYGDGMLKSVHLLSPVKAREFSWARSDAEPEAEAREQLEYVLDVLEGTWTELEGRGMELRREMRVAIASYLTPEGQPGDTRGAFGLLRLFGEDVTGWLGDGLEGKVGERISVSFEHDGTAAAMAYAGMRNAAVVMVGTALGIGYVPEVELMTLAKGFEVVSDGVD